MRSAGMEKGVVQRTTGLNFFAWFVASCTLLLVCSGGMVTSKNAGLAVPDWPTTFGYNMFLFPASKWVGGIFFEHTHRLVASTVGLLTLVLAGWLWRAPVSRGIRILGAVAVGAVILQGILGGLRVTMLKDEIGIFHACLAQAFLGLLVLIALLTSRTWFNFQARLPSTPLAPALRLCALITTLLVYLQLALGATMRHQHRDLAITDFPTAYGHWVPDTSATALAKINRERDAIALSDISAGQIWLQMAHRFGALLVMVGVVAFFGFAHRANISPLRGLSTAWLIGVIVQISLGAWMIWSNKAADIATAHVAVGATMLGLGVVNCALAWRLAERMPAYDFKSRRLDPGPIAA